MTLELTHYRKPGRVTSTIEGWIEGDQNEVLSLLAGGRFKLSALDSRIEGDAHIPGFAHDSKRHELKGDGPVTVEGRALSVGDRVRVTTGGPVLWSR